MNYRNPVIHHQCPARKEKKNLNKKVLLRDRKRHTARCVANTRSYVLSRGGGGVPQSQVGYHSSWTGIPPLPSWDWGTSPEMTWDQEKNLGLGYFPRKDLGPGKEPGTGVSPWKGPGTRDQGKNLRLGYPPPPPFPCGRTNKVKPLPSRIPTECGGKYAWNPNTIAQ